MKKNLAIFAVLALFTPFFLIFLGYSYGYHNYKKARVQPIAFTHKIHVGQLNMKCTQCHLYADKGPFATTPPLSVCKTCHVDQGVKANSPQIQKLTAHIQGKLLGELPPETEGQLAHAKIPQTIHDILKKNGTNLSEKSTVRFVSSNEWEILDGKKLWTVKKEQNKLKLYSNKPPYIEWKRIHRIPYVSNVGFTHKRHVRYFLPRYLQQILEKKQIKDFYSLPSSQREELEKQALKQTCYQCHGQVEQMTIPRKVSPLKMGWCITCHVKHNAPRDCWTCHQ